MWELIKILLIAFVLLVPGYLLFSLFIMPPVERMLGYILPWWLKAFLTSVGQSLLISVLLFIPLGFFFGESGMSVMKHHPVVFVITWAVATVFFLWTNITSDEFSSKDDEKKTINGCERPAADHLSNADGSVVDKYEGVQEVCGSSRGDGYFWFCEECLQKRLKRAGKIW